MVRPGQAAEPKHIARTMAGIAPQPLPIDRAKQLTKPFAGDDALDTWAAKMLADSEDFAKNRPQDHLGNLFVMNLK